MIAGKTVRHQLPGRRSALTRFVGRPLPGDYAAFLRRHNGGALWYRDVWYLHLWRAADIPSWSIAYGFRPSKIAGAIAIGSDGAFTHRDRSIDSDYSDAQYHRRTSILATSGKSGKNSGNEIGNDDATSAIQSLSAAQVAAITTSIAGV